MKITVTDEKDKPVIANLGVSIFDKLYQNSKDPQDILTYYDLTTSLRGRIYDPGYYFDSKNPDRESDLDLLLLTQGWRNYVWNEENLKAYKNARRIVDDGTTGEIYSASKKKKLPEGQIVSAVTADRKTPAVFITTDSANHFMVLPQHLLAGQGQYLYLKPMSAKDLRPLIRVTEPFQNIRAYLKTTATDYPLPNLTDASKPEPVRPPDIGPKIVKLHEVTIKGRGGNGFHDKYLGHLDSLTKMDGTTDYVCPNGTLNCFNHNIDRSKKPEEGKLYIVLLDINGMPTGPDYEGPRYYGQKKIVYHYIPISEKDLLEINNFTKVPGYYTNKEFYQPDYDKEPCGSLPDARNTLLWAPKVITNAEGEATLTFTVRTIMCLLQAQ